MQVHDGPRATREMGNLDVRGTWMYGEPGCTGNLDVRGTSILGNQVVSLSINEL